MQLWLKRKMRMLTNNKTWLIHSRSRGPCPLRGCENVILLLVYKNHQTNSICVTRKDSGGIMNGLVHVPLNSNKDLNSLFIEDQREPLPFQIWAKYV